MFVHRQIEGIILKHLEWYPVLYLGGPRQSGKTTLLKSLFPSFPYVSLEDPDVLLLATEDPRRFLNSFPDGAILDEAQRAPNLFSYLQTKVDGDRSLKFVLSGSQNFLLMEKITQSLAGRVGILNLFPFSFQEVSGVMATDNLEDVVWRGGYPALNTSEVPHEVFFNNYVQTYLERDVRTLKNVGDLTLFTRFMRLCAGRVGQPVNMSNIAADTGVAVNTVKAWLSVLEASYIIYFLPPYYQNFNKRLTKSPKMYFYDSGLVCYLLGIRDSNQLGTHHYLGNIVENYIVSELYKKRTNLGQKPIFWFWQDHKGNEVDLLIEENGKTKAIEIKASQTFNTRMFANLQFWKNLPQTVETSQYLVYAGPHRLTMEQGEILPWKDALAAL